MNTQQTPTILHRATFECMTLDQQQEHFSEQGFVLLPQILSSDHIARVRSEVKGVDRYDFIERWPGPHMEQLITNPKLLKPLLRYFLNDARIIDKPPAAKDHQIGKLSGQDT